VAKRHRGVSRCEVVCKSESVYLLLVVPAIEHHLLAPCLNLFGLLHERVYNAGQSARTRWIKEKPVLPVR
jgi:hypothetical protein